MKIYINKMKEKLVKPKIKINYKKINVSKFKSSKGILFKMVSVFLFLIIVPVALIGTISSNSITNYMEKDTKLKLLDTTTQTTRYFNLFTKSVEDATTQLALNEQIVNKVANVSQNKDDVYTKLNDIKQVEQELNSFLCSNKFIKRLFIIDSSGNIYSSDSDLKNIDYKDSDWYKEIIKGNKRSIWINNHEQNNKSTDYALSVGRLVTTSLDGGKDNVILLDVNASDFTDILSDIKIGKNDVSYIIAPTGKVLSAQGNSEDPNISESEFIKKIKDMSQKSEKNTLNVNYKNKNYLAGYTMSEQNGWIYVTMIPESEIKAESQILQVKIAVLGFIFVIIALIIALRFSLKITKRLNIIVDNMKLTEQGDLTVQLNDLGTDEIGVLGITFNSMIRKIKDLINQSKQLIGKVNYSCDNISNISNETTQASQEIATAIESISGGVVDQSREINNSITTINELAEKIKFVVNSIKIIEDESQNVRKATNIGIKSISTLVNKTDETSKITGEVITEFDTLNQYIRNINQVTNVLENIASQTSLLSLNASIEAARAGEAGKGFGVVADEVKKLAEQSSSSTKDIQELIQKISEQTHKTTALMDKTGLIVKEQGEAVNDSSNSFSNINERSNLLFDNINGIITAIENIDKNKNDVINSINNIATVSEKTSAATQEISAFTEEQAASVEELDNMIKQVDNLSNNLKDAMDKFKL